MTLHRASLTRSPETGIRLLQVPWTAIAAGRVTPGDVGSTRPARPLERTGAGLWVWEHVLLWLRFARSLRRPWAIAACCQSCCASNLGDERSHPRLPDIPSDRGNLTSATLRDRVLWHTSRATAVGPPHSQETA